MKLTNKYDVHYYYGIAQSLRDDEIARYYDPNRVRIHAAEDIETLCDLILELEEKLEQGG